MKRKKDERTQPFVDNMADADFRDLHDMLFTDRVLTSERLNELALHIQAALGDASPEALNALEDALSVRFEREARADADEQTRQETLRATL